MIQNSDNSPYIPRKFIGGDSNEGVDLSKLFHRKLKDGELAKPIEHDAKDIQELQDFCSKHGILGVNFGNQNPKAILAMLKSKIGIIDIPQEGTDKPSKGLLNG